MPDPRVTLTLDLDGQLSLNDPLFMDPKSEAELIYNALVSSLPYNTWRELSRLFSPDFYNTRPLVLPISLSSMSDLETKALDEIRGTCDL